MNSTLKLIDFKKCTKEFYYAMTHGVNMLKGDNPIIFLKDEGYIRKRKMISDKMFDDED